MDKTARKFWVNYGFDGPMGSGEGSCWMASPGPITSGVMVEWRKALESLPSLQGCTVIIRTFTELEG